MIESKLAARLGLWFPILQAPIGSLAGVELAAAVSNGGGLGGISLTWRSPQEAQKLMLDVKAATEMPFQINFVLEFECPSFDIALEHSPKVVTFSWGQPGKRAQSAKSAGALV